MSDSESEDQHELGEFKEKNGFTYRRLGKARQIFTLGKVSLTILLLGLVALLVLVIMLQIATMVLVRQSTPASSTDDSSVALSSQMGQLMKSFNATCSSISGHNNDQQILEAQQNASDLLRQLYDVTQLSARKLINIVQSLSNLESSSSTTKGAVDDILLVANELLKIQNVSSSIAPLSCQDVKKTDPSSPSGYYHINSQLVYCEMGQLCGSSDGWTRVGHLDMTDATEHCPSTFRFYQGENIRGCGRPDGGAGCVSVKFPSYGVSYSEVCGKVTGYQFGTPDAVDTRFVTPAVHNDINQHYVDGVSITHGDPRSHIWTLMAGVKDSSYDDGNCPCNSPLSNTQQIQSFVGNDYFCESGNPTQSLASIIYATDPLWDGSGCGSQEQACCSPSLGLPWFHKTVGTTTDFVELRECGDENDDNEDVIVSAYDIYVK